MAQLRKPDDAQTTRPDRPKMAYAPPKLVRYGSVAKLTKALAGSIDDLAAGMKMTGDVG